MGFLREFYSASAQDPRLGMGVFITWLRRDWRSMYAELRAERPILPASTFTIVTRASDVLDVLAQPSLFTVSANRLPMDGAVGPFMLARDETEINWEEKGLMQSVLCWEDLPAVRDLAAETACKALDEGEGTLDIVPALSRMVPLRIVQRIFGFTASDEDLLRWSFATQHGMFRNLPFHQEILDRCHAAGREMQAWLWPFLARKWAAAPLEGTTSIDRLINLSHGTGAQLAPERVISNVCGLLVGAIETMSAAIVQTCDQLLSHPEWLEMALAADAADDVDAFDAIIFEALRFNPITTFQLRVAAVPRVLAEGTDHATPVEAGTLLAICTGSAMFDPALMPDPDLFDCTRPPSSYLHFGLGHHECLGRHIGRVAIPEAVRQILLLPGVQRATGRAGQLDFAGGPFPEHLQISWETARLACSLGGREAH